MGVPKGTSQCLQQYCVGYSAIGPTCALLLSWVLWEVVEQSKKQQFTPDPAAQPPCPAFAGWTLQPWQPAHSCQQFPGCCHHRRYRWEAENRVSAGPQLSESPAEPFGCWDLQLLKPCLPFPSPFSPFSPGRLKPDKKGQMRLPLDKSLQVSRELLGTHT